MLECHVRVSLIYTPSDLTEENYLFGLQFIQLVSKWFLNCLHPNSRVDDFRSFTVKQSDPEKIQRPNIIRNNFKRTHPKIEKSLPITYSYILF